MKNMQEIIDRYKNVIPEGRSVTGFLMWGGKPYYEINSKKPLSINSITGVEFITNKKGQVQLYDLGKKVKGTFETSKWWGKTVKNYYPWPWFPKKKIAYFEVVRILPTFQLGDKIYTTRATLHFNPLDYPEFFKPIYK